MHADGTTRGDFQPLNLLVDLTVCTKEKGDQIMAENGPILEQVVAQTGRPSTPPGVVGERALSYAETGTTVSTEVR